MCMHALQPTKSIHALINEQQPTHERTVCIFCALYLCSLCLIRSRFLVLSPRFARHHYNHIHIAAASMYTHRRSLRFVYILSFCLFTRALFCSLSGRRETDKPASKSNSRHYRQNEFTVGTRQLCMLVYSKKSVFHQPILRFRSTEHQSRSCNDRNQISSVIKCEFNDKLKHIRS